MGGGGGGRKKRRREGVERNCVGTRTPALAL